MRPTTHTARPPLRRWRHAAATLLASALLAGGVSGCGVRLETAPHSEPVPDAAELVRRTAAEDALAIVRLIHSAEGGTGITTTVANTLDAVAVASTLHAEALGGEYDSGLEVFPDIAPPPQQLEPGEVSIAEVVTALTDAAGRNRTAANNAPDGGVARLLASIGASQLVYATRLATSARLPVPEIATVVIPAPSAPEGPDPGDGDAPTADVEGAEEGIGAPGVGDSHDEYPQVPVPEGPSASDFSSLTMAEDSVRFALEILAAHAEVGTRTELFELSQAHGERAAAWARLGGLAGTGQDPRRLAYEVPRNLDVDEVLDALATQLIVDYATLVGVSSAGTRSLFIDLLTEIALTLEVRGQNPGTFPGMPELADGLPVLEAPPEPTPEEG